jgi:hypothetical protein
LISDICAETLVAKEMAASCHHGLHHYEAAQGANKLIVRAFAALDLCWCDSALAHGVDEQGTSTHALRSVVDNLSKR